MTHQDVRRRNAGALKELVQISRTRLAAMRIWTGVAPAVAGAIEPAGLRGLRYFRLNGRPRVPGQSRACVENYARGALAGARDIQIPAANIHGPADSGKS